MTVARRHVGAAAVADEARQGEAAADLEDPLAGRHRPRAEAGREPRARRPEQAEHRPRRRRDADPLGRAVVVGELLAVEQRADDEIVDRRRWRSAPAWSGSRASGRAKVLASLRALRRRPEYARRRHDSSRFVRVRGAREHNLKDVDVDIPRDALVVFSGVSGSGKSSLAFGTLYAEAQRRYFESVSPYARRLIDQVGVPDVDSIEGLPPAVALQQQRGTPGRARRSAA
jgi:ABC-type glutathione transport system ATPase component